MLPVAALPAPRIAEALGEAGLSPLAPGVAERFSAYYSLLDRWNAKLNLTAIRTPEESLQRHFVECIFCAQRLPADISTLLDYGSGAGFPGIPIALCRPEIRVTLAESQGKKAGFLREAVRTLGIETEVYGGRVEEMAGERVFDVVTLRAVDKIADAILHAGKRVDRDGWMVLLSAATDLVLPSGFVGDKVAIPGSARRVIVRARREHVPRGTL
jgi:16S rRNA (guanine527-N7)-methyltransferase